MRATLPRRRPRSKRSRKGDRQLALSSRLTTTLPIPGEDGQSVTIRKLSKRASDEAQEAKLRYFATVKDLASAVSTAPPDPAQAAAVLAANPYVMYDQPTVLRHCVTAWTYSAAPTPDEIDDLDVDTATWLFNECMKFSVRGPEEGEGSGPTSGSPSATGEVGPESSTTSS